MSRSRKSIMQATLVSCFSVALLFLVLPQQARTYPPFLAKAKSLGYPAKDCTYCHVNAAGGEPFNARGQWLIAEKEKRGASSVDIAWLKDYKEGGGEKSKESGGKASASNQTETSNTSTAQRAGKNRQGLSASATTVVVGKGAEPVRALSGSMMGNEISARLGNDQPGFSYVLTGAEIVDGKLQLQGTLKPAGGANGASMRATLIGTLSRARNPWPSANDSAASARQKAADANKGKSSASAAQATGNPAPSAGQVQKQGRETRNPENTAQLGELAQSTQSTARTTQTPTAPQGQRPSAGEANEQSQSLYSAAAVGLGCEIIYLKLQLPAQLDSRANTQGQPVQLGVVLAPMDNKRGEEINNQMCRVIHALNSTGEDAQAQVAQLNRLLAANGSSSSSARVSGR